jgi:drug/metabolite transporter (DMT)-like permease
LREPTPIAHGVDVPQGQEGHVGVPLNGSGNRRSIVAMLIAVGAFSLMDAILKTLTGSYPALQVAALRGMAALPLVCIYVVWRRDVGQLLRVRWHLHLFRGVIGILMLSLFSYALRVLGLAEAYAIFFIAPLLITMLSIPVLGEKVAPLHWLAIAVGMVGVWIALRPQGEAFFSLGALAVLGAAACYAVSAVTGRVLSRTDASVTLVFWTTVSLSFGAGVLALPGWVPIAAAHGPVLLALAVTGFIGQLAITEAFRHGQASAVAPFEYTALAWGIALDWSLWRIVPDRYTLLGGAIIIVSGLYLLRKERVKSVAIPP